MTGFSVSALKRDLYDDEGYRRSVYKDHLGYDTIGIGRLVDAQRGGGITKDEAFYLLGNDIADRAAQLDSRIPWWRDLLPCRQRALMNMAFQLGVNGLMNFKKMLAALQVGDYAEAERQALDSNWARQTPERAKRVSALLGP